MERPPRGSEGSRLLALAAIRALGLNGRPEARLELLSVRKDHEKEQSNSATSMRIFEAVEEALGHYERFRKLGPTAFQRLVFRRLASDIQTSAE